jgi:hypothetical protein
MREDLQVPRHSHDKANGPTARGGRGDRVAFARQHDGTEAIARYLADMIGQLESMARAANLELLAYLLAMARAEAESSARKPPGAAEDLEP